MSSLDLNRLFQAHTVLSCLASLSDAPVWNPAIAIVGLVLVPTFEGAADTAPSSSEAARHFVSVLGVSIVLDFFWFTSHSTHGMSRVFILINWLLKLVTLLNLNSQLQARGGPAGGFSFPGAGSGGTNGAFSIPAGLTDRFASVFPTAGQHAQRPPQPGRETSETVWSAPGSYQQTRFSLDEEEGSIGSLTPPPVTVSGVQSPLGESKRGGGSGAAPPPPPQYSAGSTSGAGARAGAAAGKGGGSEGGGYHTLE
ncbi:hypothetical protein RHOSPDRAFT_31428 [Rhodotorula sp. JG-1b]|nr:hypothetical protein RHOSPDRAFT_31428 [Rhodotorula sp. JG-1b]